MPELPEVQTVVDTLRPHVVGRRVVDFELLRDDFATADINWLAAIRDRQILDVIRRAKRIVFTLDDGHRFFAHLGMTGRVTLGPARRERARHTHVILTTDAGVEVHFVDPRRFGGLVWLGKAGDGHTLGPEPLSLPPRQLYKRLQRTRRHIKSALLDQKLIAGLGNIYVDEALFAAGIHPMTRSHDVNLDQARKLNRAIKSTLRRAIRHRGSTLRDYVDADGNGGGFQRLHRVYDRAGLPCRQCRTPVERLVLGGRSTHFCPRCQPAAA